MALDMGAKLGPSLGATLGRFALALSNANANLWDKTFNGLSLDANIGRFAYRKPLVRMPSGDPCGKCHPYGQCQCDASSFAIAKRDRCIAMALT